MNGIEWLDELTRRVGQRLDTVDIYRADADTLTLAIGGRGVTAHDDGDMIWLAPSIARGGTIAARPQDRVTHLDIQTYGVNEPTIDVAVDAVLEHLCG